MAITLLHGSSTLKWAQTQLCRPSGYGMDLFLVPYSRLLSYCSVNRAQLGQEGYILDNLSPSGLGCHWLPTTHTTRLLCLKGPIHDSNFQPQPLFPTATSTKFPVFGLQQPQPQLAGRGCSCCRSEFSDNWWAELKVAVEVGVVAMF